MGVFTRWVLGRGRLPEEERGQLQAEGILYLDEGVWAMVTYRHYRAPGRRYGYRRCKLPVALAMTERRLLVYNRGGPLVSVGWEQARAGGLASSLDDGSLVVSFDAGAFAAGRSGSVEARIQTAQAPAAAAVAQAKLS